MNEHIFIAIENDIESVFSKITKDLKNKLNNDFEVESTKMFIIEHIPKIIEIESEILLDTLINYLMKIGMLHLENAEIDLQNQFLRDFREKIKEIAKVETGIELELPMFEFSADPSLKKGVVTGGITLALGVGVTITVAKSGVLQKMITTLFGVSAPRSTIIGVIFLGLLSIILSGFVFKKSFEKAKILSRETIRIDTQNHLVSTKIQVTKWLNNVIKAFNKEFNKLCSNNGFKEME